MNKKTKDYRKIYKEHYGIEFGKEFEVHHLDHDRSNNDISNLLLLPYSVHHRLHFYEHEIDEAFSYIRKVPTSEPLDTPNTNPYQLQMVKGYVTAIGEVLEWKLAKETKYRMFNYEGIKVQ